MSLRASCVLLLGVALAFGAPPDAEGREGFEPRRDVPVEITADRIVDEVRRQVYVAEGNVRVVQGERRIDADWIVFTRVTRRGLILRSSVLTQSTLRNRLTKKGGKQPIGMPPARDKT